MSATSTAVDRPPEITVYTLPGCPHCVRARSLLKRRGLAFREIDGTQTPDFRARLADLTGGFTVPQIVIDGTPIGGADRLARLDRAGVLAAIADHEAFPIARERRRTSPRLLARWAGARLRGRRDVSPVKRVQVRPDRAGRVVDAVNRDPQT
ncbi:MAG: glutaredoxin domain-containing protein [Solirubrobacteraceae bacterium]